MIHVNNLKKTYGTFEALKGIDIHVAKNDIYGFLGHNGAGKSTTINILAGLSKMDSGKIFIDGKEISSKLGCRGNYLGYLPEEPCFYPWMTAKEYLSYIGSDYGKRTLLRVDEMLEWVGLMKAANRKIGGFSRGMRQRLGMAVALFYDPDLLLLDEPSSALDPQGRADVLSMIKRLKDENKTIFLSTHILDDVERVCNKVGILSSGEIIKEMELSSLLNEYIAPIYDVVFSTVPSETDILKARNCKWIKDLNLDEEIMSIKVHDENAENQMIYSLISRFDTAVKSVNLRGHSLEQIFIEMTRSKE